MQRDFFGSARDAVLMADDWDLYAVVRSCKATAAKAAAIKAPEEAFSNLEAFLLEEEEEEKDHPFSFPNLLEQTTNGFQELHHLCQPFLSKTTSINELETLNSSLNLQKYNQSVNSPSALMKQKEEEEEEEEDDDKQKSQNQQDLNCSPTSQPQTPRTRRRKFQQERIVCQVTADNLSTDMWAWRKYGQKPIKGSPHPRNYYRRSSSKGCSARKQVERSTSDPNTFTISYTGKHTHPPPLHKNSLAGSTRNKIPATETAAAVASTASSSSPSGLSPTTPFAVENEEESIKETSNGEEKGAEEIAFSEYDKDILIPNMAAMENDIFLGPEGFGYEGVGRTRAIGENLTSPEPPWNPGSSTSAGATASGGSWKSPPQFAGR